MEQHEANNNMARRRADQAFEYSSSAFVVPPSPPSDTPKFRSTRLNFAAAPPLAPPLVQPDLNKMLNAPTKSGLTPASHDDSLPLAMAKKKEAVGTIPVMPSFHILDRTAIRISEDITSVGTLLDRVLQYLRDHSIRYECEQDTGCLDCMSPSMVGFCVQLWRDNNSSKQIIVEVQRREGCAIALNAIRRSFLRHVKGEQQNPAAAMAGRRRPISECNGRPFNNAPALQQTGSNKRRRSLSPHSSRMNCQDALVLSLRLLESPMRDQQKIGLESLTVLTDSRLVNPIDAASASRALALGDSPAGARMQQRLGKLLGEYQAALGGGNRDAYHANVSAMLYHIALHALANTLDQLARDSRMTGRVNLDSPFWQTTAACLVFSLNSASRSPHEAALAAKCIRHLLPAPAAAQRLQVPTMQSSLQRTFELGQAHNASLAEESKKALCFFKA